MIKIINNLWLGSKDDRAKAKGLGMNILCAMNRGEGINYQSVFGQTRPGDENYYFGYHEGDLYLNLIDARDIKYVSTEAINEGIKYIANNLMADQPVFVYCSKGESRSPSLVLMYLTGTGILPKNKAGVNKFLNVYPNYNPGPGMKEYVTKFMGL